MITFNMTLDASNSIALHHSTHGFLYTLLLLGSMASFTLSGTLSQTNSTTQTIFVRPNNSVPCSIESHFPCLILRDYASYTHTFFVNHSTYFFDPGKHVLNVRVKLTSRFSIFFKGNNATIVLLKPGSIILESSKNIYIYNINFRVENNTMSYILSFVLTSITMTNITVLGNNYKGCSSIISTRSTVDIFNSKFYTMIGDSGAVLRANRSIITFKGSNIFSNNTAYLGGAIFLQNSTVAFYGHTSFVNNRAITRPFSLGGWFPQFRSPCKHSELSGLGGAVFSVNSIIISGNFSTESFDVNHTLFLKNNSATQLGGAIALINTSMQLCGHLYFVQSNARSGVGPVYLQCNASNISSTTSHEVQVFFLNNNASKDGGALWLSKSHVSLNVHNTFYEGSRIVFANNFAKYFGGAVKLIHSSVQIFESAFFIENTANLGGAVHISELSTLMFNGSISFTKNSAKVRGGAISTVKSTISFISAKCKISKLSEDYKCKTFELDYNRAKMKGGAIASTKSQSHFIGKITFFGNTAKYGGAVFLDSTSNMNLQPMLTLNFVQNVAEKKGGAVYYNDSSSCYELHRQSSCFFFFRTSLKNVLLLFENNSAFSGGTALHIGLLIDGNCNTNRNFDCYCSSIDRCNIYSFRPNNQSNLLEVLLNVSIIISNNTETNVLADVGRISFCQEGKQSLSHNQSAYPGQKFNVFLAALGPLKFNVGMTKIDQKMSSDMDNVALSRVSRSVRINTTCTNIFYHLKANDIKKSVTVKYKLYHQNQCESLVCGVNFTINVNPCPLGFQLLVKDETCVCDKRISKLTQKCDIDTLTIERRGNTFWITETIDNRYIYHEHSCPLDFCKKTFVNVSLSNPDVQCDFNRTGTLCGQCKQNYSLALGTLHCIECNNQYFIALILPFAFAGIFLVILILFLHLTVDLGTLNGLIFYVNIVHSNRQAFFNLEREAYDFVTVFISWLNLDLGIETCFYKGMDIYTYSWLQFLFPFYLWFMIGAIIIACRYSKRIAKVLGQNPVAALATLLFLSYGKILNATITPLSLTQLTFAQNNRHVYTYSVWLFEGNIKYFKDPTHIVLGTFALLIILTVLLPYTFFLLCGHWLMAYSDKCFLSWLNRIKPFMDVYYAPFKKEARYWIGLMLLSRLALLLTIAINTDDSDQDNILVIASVTAGLLFIKGRVYEHKYKDYLESSFLFNLCVFSIANLYIKDGSSYIKYIISSASIAISFITFIGIITFHVYLLLKSTKFWREWIVHGLSVYKMQLYKKVIQTKAIENVALNKNDAGKVTSTLVELREPLLEVDEV